MVIRWAFDRPAWQEHALCAGMPQDGLFFASDDQGEKALQLAVQLCRRCPVRCDCLDYALTNREEHGIWGGLTSVERKRIRWGRASRPIPSR